MKRARSDWQATGTFQVGVACQASGRYEDAIAAYRNVLAREGFAAHVPTLHNLAVSQIRAGDPAGAIETLDSIDTVIPTRPTRAGLAERSWNAGYNRSLALQYLGEFDAALRISHKLLRELLARPEVHKLEAPTLMLHAGLLLSVADPVEPREHKARRIPPVVKRCATAIAERPPNSRPPTRDALYDAIWRGAERPEQIDAYVTAHFAEDPRARYNLLCFHARLAERLPHSRARLREIARQDARVAFRDRRLATWAREDPALDLRHLRAQKAWRQVLTPPELSSAPRAREPSDDGASE